ncbi:MAG TPA: serine/threonine protein kinase, partial [Polyangia bacterium]|nr:serine/threonine protein kinase [Polyangia bacterium]
GGAKGTGGAGGTGGTTATGGVPGSGGAVATVGGIFTAAEPWTEDVSGLTKDASSDAIIADLDSEGGWGGGVLQIDFSIPLFVGDAATPRQTITALAGQKYCYGGTDCDPVPLQMPVPTNGNAEGSSNYTCDTSGKTDGQGDCHVLVVAADEQKLYELYNATQGSSGLTARGAFIWDLTKAYPDNLRGDQCTSADAAGFPIAALLPTADEVAAGAVSHALRFILPNESMAAGVYVHPATHAGSPSSPDASAPPYGVRFRLKAGFDVSAYNASEKVILAAMKKYGMLLSDGGTIALTFADDRTTTAKWADLGVTARSFAAITVDDFEVVDFSAEIPLTDDCVRNP